jgi:dipeptidyl aminopeptidase/acylaminoacyl peptidase
VGADRLVNTVKRLVNNDLLWRVDYSIVLEMNEVNLRAFGGGLSPVRSLESVLSDPQPDYVPHIFMLNTAAGELFLDRILMSEMKADRWAAIVVAEDIAPRVYRGLGEFHVVHGGNTLAYGEDKCFEWTGQGADRECRIFRQVLVTYPLDATDGESPKVLTPVNAFDGANRPQWSWDEEKIAFDAFPEGRLGRAQIFVMDRDGGGVRQLTSESQGQNGARSASWSPNNIKIVYVSDRESFSWDIWVMNAEGSGQQNLTKGRVKFPNGPRFSPDGRRIMFSANDNEPAGDRRGGPDSELWIMDRDGGNLTKVTSNEVDDENGVWGQRDRRCL